MLRRESVLCEIDYSGVGCELDILAHFHRYAVTFMLKACFHTLLQLVRHTSRVGNLFNIQDTLPDFQISRRPGLVTYLMFKTHFHTSRVGNVLNVQYTFPNFHTSRLVTDLVFKIHFQISTLPGLVTYLIFKRHFHISKFQHFNC